MRLLLDRPVEVCGGDQLAEVGIALVVLGQQNEPVDPRLTPISGGRAMPSIAPITGWTPLPMQASLSGIAP